MEKIRGKSLQEWKEYCSSENVPVKTMKYIFCLEERIKQLTLTEVSHRRELLIDLLTKLEKGGGNRFVSKEWIVDNYLQGN
jgi:hypothetical protein